LAIMNCLKPWPDDREVLGVGSMVIPRTKGTKAAWRGIEVIVRKTVSDQRG
jgi:hypothetical protein